VWVAHVGVGRFELPYLSPPAELRTELLGAHFVRTRDACSPSVVIDHLGGEGRGGVRQIGVWGTSQSLVCCRLMVIAKPSASASRIQFPLMRRASNVCGMCFKDSEKILLDP
jgi:hypothetical protein